MCVIVCDCECVCFSSYSCVCLHACGMYECVCGQFVYVVRHFFLLHGKKRVPGASRKIRKLYSEDNERGGPFPINDPNGRALL